MWVSTVSETVTLNMKGLEALIKALKATPPVARVGVLGGRALRTGGPNNAIIGAHHEFGTSTLPVRSFLRMPISSQLEKRMQASGDLDPNIVKQIVKTGSLLPWVKRIAVMAEGIVADAFDTGGFGTWIPSDMSRKQNHQTLVETQQLRNSITSEVKENG